MAPESGYPARVIDVSHNPQAAERLAACLSQHPLEGRNLAVLAMLRDKDADGYLSRVEEHVWGWFIATNPDPRGMQAEDLAAVVKSRGGRILGVEADFRSAYRLALAGAETGDRVIACGSFASARGALAVEAEIRTEAG